MYKSQLREGSRFLMAVISTDDIQPRAQAALAASPIHDLRSLRVDKQEGALRIMGTVSSFYHKQLAQEVVRSVCHGTEVVNSIQVD